MMFHLSPKRVVILAAVCFAGLVILQIVWMSSAYEGEIALYEKAKKQFEGELQSWISHNEEVKTGLKTILDQYDHEHQLTHTQIDWFHYQLVPLIDLSPAKSQFDIFLDGISIVQYRTDDSLSATRKTLVSNIYEDPGLPEPEKAGKICIDCISDLKNDSQGLYTYQLLLFYRHPKIVVYKKLDFLIILSLSLLIILSLLFRQILRKYKQERRLSEAKNDFINNLSHEMQTPVFAIQMANKLIMEKVPEISEITPLTQIIEKETRQLKQNATKILELASLESDQIELHKEIVDLNLFIEHRAQTIELMLKERGGELKLKIYPRKLYCELDPVHFNNVLISIVDNAIKYTAGTPLLIIETGESAGWIYLKFIDNGRGIAKEYLPFIGEKFFRVPDIKRSGPGGFGIGLNYVKYIIKLLKGEIRIESQEGIGTSITILLSKAIAHV